MKLYRGYFPLNDKQPLMKWKRENVPDEGLLTLEQAQTHSDYGAALAEETAVVDIDERPQAMKLYEAVQAEGMKCRVIDTDRGMHFIFSNKAKRYSKNFTHVRFAVGLAGDVKVGCTNAYEKLKSHGKDRRCVYGEDLTDTDQLDEVPVWLSVIGKADKTPDYPNMGDGDGRNDALYQHSFDLQKRGFAKEDVWTTCMLLNSYVFEEPLSEAEIGSTALREDSLNVSPTFDTEDVEEARDALRAELEYTDKGALKNKIENVITILKMNPAFDCIRKNQLSGVIEADDSLPWTRDKSKKEWTDEDDAALRLHLEKFFDNIPPKKVLDALIRLAEDRGYHPVRDYLEGLPEWDGVERVDYLLVDFFGAEDTEYVHQVTRKTLCAAVIRVYEPGRKVDTMLVLNGKQGIGKSTLIAKLGMQWFTDALKLTDLATKECVEKIQGQWIVEIGELAGMKKVDVESLRSYITRTDDYGRKAYGRNAEHRPRQCVFFGTTNAQSDGFLRDVQGNRRFWVVDLPDEGGKRTCIGDKNDLKQWEIDQIWAEAKVMAEAGEKLYLTGDVAAEAEKIQNQSIEADPREGMVAEYLDTKLPDDWYSMTVEERQNFFRFKNPDGLSGSHTRQYVSNVEILTECFGGKLGNVKQEAYAIAAIMRRIGGWHRGKGVKRIRGYGPVGFYERDVLTETEFR